MKLRIKGDSIRFRLSISDLDTFTEKGYIEERTHVGNMVFIYALLRSEDESQLTAKLDNNKIFLYVPAPYAKEWAETQRVGFDNRLPLPDGGELYLLIEKDFKCLDETEEDQSDNFDNPLLANN